MAFTTSLNPGPAAGTRTGAPVQKYLLASEVPGPSWLIVYPEGNRVVIEDWIPGAPPTDVMARLVDASVRPLTTRQAAELRRDPTVPPEGYVPRGAIWGWQVVENWALLAVLPPFSQSDGGGDESWIPYRAATVTGWWVLTAGERKAQPRALYIECHTDRLELFLFSENGLVWSDSASYERQLFPGSRTEDYARLAMEQIEPVWFALLERGRITPEQMQWLSVAAVLDFGVDSAGTPVLWRDFLAQWFADSLQAFFGGEPLPVKPLPVEEYIVNLQGQGCPHVPVAIWAAVQQLSSGVGLDVRQRLLPFPAGQMTLLERARQWWRESPLAALPVNQVGVAAVLTGVLLLGWGGWRWWQLGRLEAELQLRAAAAQQRQADLARIRAEMIALRQRNRALKTLREVLEKEIPRQALPADFLARLESNYVAGVVVRRYRSDGQTLAIEGLVRQNMLAAGQRPADLVGRFVSRFEDSPDVLSVSPTVREVLGGDSPFDVKVQLRGGFRTAAIDLPPLSRMVEAEQARPDADDMGDEPGKQRSGN